MLVQAGARRERVVGILRGCWKVAVTAAPEKGKANESVRKFLARVTGVPRAAVALSAGFTSREKTFRVRGISPEALQQKLEAASE